MPELPEVETVMRGLAERLQDRRLVDVEARRPDLRWPLPDRFAARLSGRRVTGLRRRAKYIFVDLDDGQSLIIHLGMSGRMLISDGAKPALERHDHVVLHTDDDTWVRYNDARRFGMMDLWPTGELDRHKLIKAVGPEPLGNEFSGPILYAALDGRRTPIKAALLDQKVVAGVGNIYACEALHRAGISPRRLATNVSRQMAERLAAAVKTILQEAIAAGGSSLRDHRQVSGELGYFQHTFRVYDREGEPCPTDGCTGTVKRLVQSGRSTFYCPRCQR